MRKHPPYRFRFTPEQIVRAKSLFPKLSKQSSGEFAGDGEFISGEDVDKYKQELLNDLIHKTENILEQYMISLKFDKMYRDTAKAAELMYSLRSTAKEINDHDYMDVRKFTHPYTSKIEKYRELVEQIAEIPDGDLDPNYGTLAKLVPLNYKLNKDEVDSGKISIAGIEMKLVDIKPSCNINKKRGRPRLNHPISEAIHELDFIFKSIFRDIYGDAKCAEYISWVFTEIGVSDSATNYDAVRKELQKINKIQKMKLAAEEKKKKEKN